MSAELVVGPLDAETSGYVSRIARRLGLADPFQSDGAAPESGSEDEVGISVLNVASLNFFNLTVAGLEGLGESEAMDKTSFRNLPWWLSSVWLPSDFATPRELASDDGDPLFVGSAVQLLSELAVIQSRSQIDLSSAPPGYDDMRRDFSGWLRNADDVSLSDDDTFRWIWHALRDGAEIAVNRNLPLMLLA